MDRHEVRQATGLLNELQVPVVQRPHRGNERDPTSGAGCTFRVFVHRTRLPDDVYLSIGLILHGQQYTKEGRRSSPCPITAKPCGTTFSTKDQGGRKAGSYIFR